VFKVYEKDTFILTWVGKCL